MNVSIFPQFNLLSSLSLIVGELPTDGLIIQCLGAGRSVHLFRSIATAHSCRGAVAALGLQGRQVGYRLSEGLIAREQFLGLLGPSFGLLKRLKRLHWLPTGHSRESACELTEPTFYVESCHPCASVKYGSVEN